MPTAGCKPWSHSKVEIEREVLKRSHRELDTEIGIKSGFQLRTTISHYPCPLFSSCYHYDPVHDKEYFVSNYMSVDGGGSIVTEWMYSADDNTLVPRRKFKIRSCLKHLVWVASQRIFVGYCDDMTLRGYMGSTFEEKVRVSVANSTLCVMYLEDFHDLITAGQSHITSWRVHQIDFGKPFEWKDPPIVCDFTDDADVWISYLWYSKRVKMLLALSARNVYMIDMKARKQVLKVENSHKASLTSCAWYPRYSQMITAARDGTIHIHNTVTSALIHQFLAHRDGLTGVECLPSQPILLTWSHTTGCVRMWRLDTLDKIDESTLSEGISVLHLVGSDRLYYQTDCDIRIFDLNVLFTIFTPLTNPAQSLRLCWIENVKERRKSSQLTETASRTRLLCILEDGSVITISPVTGSVVHIIHSKKDDQHPLNVTVSLDGTSSFIMPRRGDLVQYDCTTNPGKVAKSQCYSNVTSMAVMEANLWWKVGETATKSDHEGAEGSVSALLLGFNTGFLKIVPESSRVLLENGMKKPVLMEPLKIHAGSVSILFASSERRAFSTFVVDRNFATPSFHDAFVTAGTDRMACVWRMEFTEDAHRDCFVMTPVLLSKINLGYMPRMMAGTGGVIMLAREKGLICMYKVMFDSGGAFVASIIPISIDSEMRHKSKITSLSASDILHLFLSSGSGEAIKIWDVDGQLIRELDIGANCHSACFTNGRDLFAAYRNHVILIYAHNYLPLEQLEKLLEIDDYHQIKDISAELLIPMQGGTNNDEYNVQFAHHMMLAAGESQTSVFYDESPKQKKKRARSMGQRWKYLARARKTAKNAADAEVFSESSEENLEVIAEKTLLDIPTQAVDPAHLTAGMLHRMKAWPIAPDGYIPNSVIRRLIVPKLNSFTRTKVSKPLEEDTESKFGTYFSSSLSIKDSVEAWTKKKRRATKYADSHHKFEMRRGQSILEEGLERLSEELEEEGPNVFLKLLTSIFHLLEQSKALNVAIPPSLRFNWLSGMSIAQEDLAQRLLELRKHSDPDIRQLVASILAISAITVDEFQNVHEGASVASLAHDDDVTEITSSVAETAQNMRDDEGIRLPTKQGWMNEGTNGDFSQTPLPFAPEKVPFLKQNNIKVENENQAKNNRWRDLVSRITSTPNEDLVGMPDDHAASNNLSMTPAKKKSFLEFGDTASRKNSTWMSGIKLPEKDKSNKDKSSKSLRRVPKGYRRDGVSRPAYKNEALVILRRASARRRQKLREVTSVEEIKSSDHNEVHAPHYLSDELSDLTSQDWRPILQGLRNLRIKQEEFAEGMLPPI